MYLTPSEREVLTKVAQGTAVKQFEDRSEYNVKKHLKGAREKLGAVTTANAVYIAMREGLI